MEIKNKLINTKQYRKNVALNQKMKKKAKRYENKDMEKCTLLEQCLYTPIKSKIKTIKNEKNKFIKFNENISLLYLFHKSEADSLCNRLIKMFFENPMNENIFSTMIDNQFIERFNSYKNSTTGNFYGHIGHIEPKKILNIVKSINILIFNFSSNYIGLAFECDLNEKILSELNELIICDIDDYTEYREYYIGSKKQIGRYEWNPNIIRKNNLNNTLIEIKCKINDFLNYYLKFEKSTIYVPISLNFYKTNYRIEEKLPSIMSSHDWFGYRTETKIEKFSLYEHFDDKSDEFIKTDVCFEAGKSIETIDRSAKLYMYVDSEKKNLFTIPESVIDIYIAIVYFYKLYEFEELLIKERNAIFSLYSTNKKGKIYNSYNSFLNEILNYKTIFADIAFSRGFFEKDYFKKIKENLEKYYERLLEECEELEKYFEDKLAIENIKETRNVSYISLLIAMISIIIAIIPIISDNSKADKLIENLDNIKSSLIDTKEDIKEIECETKEINNEIKSIQNYIDVNKKL